MHASERLASNLQRVLVDLIDLQLQGKQAHWNIVGTNFRDLHLQLDELVDAARAFSDDVAERMRALYRTPDGRARTVSEGTSLEPFPIGEVGAGDVVEFIASRIEAVVATVRAVHDEVDAEDPSTADLLHAVILGLEKLEWLVSAEQRRPASEDGQAAMAVRAESGA